MKTADLYVRVSTDEQAAKGYSPKSQEEALRRHCETHDIAIGNDADHLPHRTGN